MTISAAGDGCTELSTEDAQRTCFVATNLIATLIGGEAYGELNDRHTPAFDALVWRARADADPATCARGGLVGPLLVECELAAQADDYEYQSGNVRVRVPIGGALPDAAPGATAE